MERLLRKITKFIHGIRKQDEIIIVTGPESEMVEMKDTGEAVPVWYIDDWYTRNKHTVSIQSAIDALHMIGDWRKEHDKV